MNTRVCALASYTRLPPTPDHTCVFCSLLPTPLLCIIASLGQTNLQHAATPHSDPQLSCIVLEAPLSLSSPKHLAQASTGGHYISANSGLGSSSEAFALYNPPTLLSYLGLAWFKMHSGAGLRFIMGEEKHLHFQCYL